LSSKDYNFASGETVAWKAELGNISGMVNVKVKDGKQQLKGRWGHARTPCMELRLIARPRHAAEAKAKKCMVYPSFG
jgi:hypothetical protein